MSPEEYYHYLIDWAGTRIDYLSSRSCVVSAKKLKKYHQGNANAIEEEFFDWFSNSNSGKKSNVLFVPYYEDVENSSAE